MAGIKLTDYITLRLTLRHAHDSIISAFPDTKMIIFNKVTLVFTQSSFAFIEVQCILVFLITKTHKH